MSAQTVGPEARLTTQPPAQRGECRDGDGPSGPGNEALLPLTLLPSTKLPLPLDHTGSIGAGPAVCLLGEPVSGAEEQQLRVGVG